MQNSRPHSPTGEGRWPGIKGLDGFGCPTHSFWWGSSNLPNPRLFSALPPHSNDMQKVINKQYTFMLSSSVFANQNLRLRVPRPIVAPFLPPPSRISHHFITSLLHYILLNRHCDENSLIATPLVPAGCKYPLPATPFLAHPYKCPGGMGLNTSILKVLLELFLLSTHLSAQKTVL
jgi:hypothetical protein